MRSDAPTTTAGGFEPAGTALLDGFTVPGGTRLAGSVFSNPLGREYELPGWSALLEIEGDPFDAWDGLAAQARARGYRFAGSRDACSWYTAPVPSADGVVESSSGPDTPADPDSVANPPRTPPEAMFCDASSTAAVPGTGVEQGAGTTLTAALVWGRGGGFGDASEATTAAHLYITDQEAYGGSTEGRAFAGRRASESFNEEPAPASADRYVPKVNLTQPVSGEPLGTANDCFEAGYDRLVVPPSAKVLADAWGIERDFTFVVEAKDARAFFDDIARQLEGPPDDADDGDPQIDTAKTADDATVLTFSNSVSGGGGGCSGQASADGRYVIFHSYSD